MDWRSAFAIMDPGEEYFQPRTVPDAPAPDCARRARPGLGRLRRNGMVGAGRKER
jgi:hypothetical protein